VRTFLPPHKLIKMPMTRMAELGLASLQQLHLKLSLRQAAPAIKYPAKKKRDGSDYGVHRARILDRLLTFSQLEYIAPATRLLTQPKAWLKPQKKPCCEASALGSAIIHFPIKNYGPSPALHLSYHIEPMATGNGTA
jgi:hypothetical protein